MLFCIEDTKKGGRVHVETSTSLECSTLLKRGKRELRKGGGDANIKKRMKDDPGKLEGLRKLLQAHAHTRTTKTRAYVCYAHASSP